MLIFHHGHSEFLLETANGLRILTDPYDAHVGYPMREVKCDVVTVSHSHGDHNCTDKVKGSALIIDRAGVTRVDDNVTVTAIPCWHDNAQGAKRGSNLIFIIDADGLRIAHFGDLGEWDESLAAQLQDIDIALLPVGGFYTLSPERAAQLVTRIQPRLLIPMHYKTQVNADWPIAEAAAFLALIESEHAPTFPLLRVTKEDLSEQPHVLLLGDR